MGWSACSVVAGLACQLASMVEKWVEVLVELAAGLEQLVG